MKDLDSHPDRFVNRHIGPSPDEISSMLAELGFDSLNDFSNEIIPSKIRTTSQMKLLAPLSEKDALRRLSDLASKNDVFKSYLGHGYYGTFTPGVIKRNILENPGWYTQYTPYQAEIAQGRLEALLNFQTMVSDLTSMDIANASLLDEATAAAEAMSMACNVLRGRRSTFVLLDDINSQTVNVVKTRAEPLEIKVLEQDIANFSLDEDTFAILLQYPTSSGSIKDLSDIVQKAHSNGSLVIVITDLLAMCMLKPPGEWGCAFC